MNLFIRQRRPTASTGAGANLYAAGAVEVAPRFVRVGEGYAATLIVTGYPAEVGPAWLRLMLSPE